MMFSCWWIYNAIWIVLIMSRQVASDDACCRLNFLLVPSNFWSECPRHVTLHIRGSQVYQERVCEFACKQTASCDRFTLHLADARCLLCLLRDDDVMGIPGFPAPSVGEFEAAVGSVWVRNEGGWASGSGCVLDGGGSSSGGSPFSVEFDSPVKGAHHTVLVHIRTRHSLSASFTFQLCTSAPQATRTGTTDSACISFSRTMTSSACHVTRTQCGRMRG